MAPAPVCMPQPSGATRCSGMSEPTLTTFRSPVMACVANEDWPKTPLPTGPCVAEGRRAVAGTHAGVVQFHDPVTVCRHVGRARRAGAAAGETHAHAVARRDLGHALADLDDDAGSLVPE